MPLYRAKESDLDFADGVDFAADDVPRAVVAMVRKTLGKARFAKVAPRRIHHLTR